MRLAEKLVGPGIMIYECIVAPAATWGVPEGVGVPVAVGVTVAVGVGVGGAGVGVAVAVATGGGLPLAGAVAVATGVTGIDPFPVLADETGVRVTPLGMS